MNVGRRFRVGGWTVLADECRIQRDGVTRHVRPLVMDLLVRLAHDAGRVVGKDNLLASVWPQRFVDESALARTVRELRQALGDEDVASPYIETVAKRGYRLVAPVTAAGDAPALCLAVLPFRDDGLEPDDGGDPGFADGMTDAVIAALARLHSLRILSHQTTAHLRGTDRVLPEIAQELGADALIEGSVLRSHGRVRVTTLLLLVDPERQVWAESFEDGLDDVLAVQDRLARAIADGVRAALDASPL